MTCETEHLHPVTAALRELVGCHSIELGILSQQRATVRPAAVGLHTSHSRVRAKGKPSAQSQGGCCDSGNISEAFVGHDTLRYWAQET